MTSSIQCCSASPFEIDRRPVTERGVMTAGIMPALDKLEDIHVGASALVLN